MNNQMNSACANAPKQSPFDEARDQLGKEQMRSEDLVASLYSRLDRALEPCPADTVGQCEPSPLRAEICHSIHGAVSVQRGINAKLQDILSRLAI